MELISSQVVSFRNMDFNHKVYGPEDCKQILPELDHPTWLYRYEHPTEPWVLCASTQGKPQSESFSLGGFRIVPAARASSKGYDNNAEAVGLAHSMSKKVFWSKLFGVAGPLAKPHLGRLVGGKCVLFPTEEARMGQPRDRELLHFAIICMQHLESSYGVFLVTGQDLGHGTMSDGKTYSIDYLDKNFSSAISADTSKPTGEGNYYLLVGLMQAAGIELSASKVGLLGCGNVGGQVFKRLRENGASVEVIESNPAKRQELEKLGVKVYTPEQRLEFLKQPYDALVVNASGGSLDEEAVQHVVASKTIKVITGSENLMVTAKDGVKRLAQAHKLYCPAEIAGMMGYLTAIEERLSVLRGQAFTYEPLLEASKPLAEVGSRVARYMIEENYALSFDEAARKIYS